MFKEQLHHYGNCEVVIFFTAERGVSRGGPLLRPLYTEILAENQVERQKKKF